jgi:hypothetical protein
MSEASCFNLFAAAHAKQQFMALFRLEEAWYTRMVQFVQPERPPENTSDFCIGVLQEATNNHGAAVARFPCIFATDLCNTLHCVSFLASA